MQTTQVFEEIINTRPLTYKAVKYGMLVEVLDRHGYHAGAKVKFFNENGALIGSDIGFVPYERLRLREGKDRQYPRYFMGKNYLKKNVPFAERLKMWLFIGVCNIVTSLLKFTQKYI